MYVSTTHRGYLVEIMLTANAYRHTSAMSHTSPNDTWIHPIDQQQFDLCVPERRHAAAANVPWGNLDPFSRFVAVAQRANPLLPAWLCGPIESLDSLLVSKWSAVATDEVMFRDEKETVLRALALRLSTLDLLGARPIQGPVYQRGSNFSKRALLSHRFLNVTCTWRHWSASTSSNLFSAPHVAIPRQSRNPWKASYCTFRITRNPRRA